jgi:hypothetical protein
MFLDYNFHFLVSLAHHSGSDFTGFPSHVYSLILPSLTISLIALILLSTAFFAIYTHH